MMTHDREAEPDPAAGGDGAIEARAHEALQRGDTRAVLKALMEGYGDEIYRHCFYIVNNRDMAEDLRQAVFLQAVEDLVRFEGRSSWRTWLRSIARNRSIDAIRRRQRWHKRLFFTDALPEVASSGGAVETLDLPASETALHHCIGKLAAQAREMVLLRYIEELPYAEISAITGLDADAVRKRVCRALPQLRKCLERQGVRP